MSPTDHFSHYFFPVLIHLFLVIFLASFWRFVVPNVISKIYCQIPKILPWNSKCFHVLWRRESQLLHSKRLVIYRIITDRLKNRNYKQRQTHQIFFFYWHCILTSSDFFKTGIVNYKLKITVWSSNKVFKLCLDVITKEKSSLWLKNAFLWTLWIKW